MTKLKFKRLSENAILPTRANPSDAGLDLHSGESVLVLSTGSRVAITTGLAVAIPEGHYGRIAPRSGVAVKYGIDVLAGVVDSSYRGPLKVVLINHGAEEVLIHRGDRIAQLIIEKIITPEAEWADELDETERGAGGFGSSGK